MKNLKEFLKLLPAYKKQIFLAFLAILAANLLGLAAPWVIKLVVDEIAARKDISLLNILSAGLVLVFILKFYFGYLYEYLSALVGENVVCDIRARLYQHLQRLSVEYIENNSAGKIISNIIGDVDSIRNFLFEGALDFIYSFFTVLFVSCVLLILDWRLTLIAFIYLPIFGVAFIKHTPRLKGKHALLREKYAELVTRLQEGFQGIRVVTGFGRQSYENGVFNIKQKEIIKTSLETKKIGILLWMGADFFSSLGLVTLIWLGTQAVFLGRISVGTLIALFSYLGMLFFPVIKMVVINNYYQEAAASLERIRTLMRRKPKVKEADNPVKLKQIKGNIEFRDVGFSYNGYKEVLSRINIQVRENEIIALMGKSGAGKTTLINLLLRFYDPTKGKILIDGYNLKDLDLPSYRSQIAMVLQDDYLFSGTVRENIAYSRLKAGRQEIIRAARLANAHQFINELPEGYDTQIGERGIKLSYGQRQRISIARALLRNPAILILDEATSAVDSETERLIINQAYKNLMQGRTTFIIAHRLLTVTCADRIILLDKGCIIETGNHSELVEKQGNYWKMWREQFVSQVSAEVAQK